MIIIYCSEHSTENISETGSSTNKDENNTDDIVNDQVTESGAVNSDSPTEITTNSLNGSDHEDPSEGTASLNEIQEPSNQTEAECEPSELRRRRVCFYERGEHVSFQ